MEIFFKAIKTDSTTCSGSELIFLVFEFQLYFGFYVNEFYVIIPEKIIASKVREGNIWHPWRTILSTRGKELLTTILLKTQLSNSSRRLSISMLNYHIQYKFAIPCNIYVGIWKASYCYKKDKWRLKVWLFWNPSTYTRKICFYF